MPISKGCRRLGSIFFIDLTVEFGIHPTVKSLPESDLIEECVMPYEDIIFL